jgi:hypothetical protein
MEKNVTVTVKTKLGSLVTLRADEPQEFADRVDAAAKAGFGVAVTAYEGLINESTTPLAVDAVAQALGATVIASPAPLAPAPLAPVPPAPTSDVFSPTCKHGVKKHKTGNGAKGEWQAWMCPSPKGTPDQCTPDWIRKGEPGWK